MSHGKIRSVLRGKSLPVSVVFILALGSVISCGNTPPLAKAASPRFREPPLPLQHLHPVNGPGATVHKGDQHSVLIPQPRWIF
ncbi:hypothetical protein EV691_10862 [Azotobacter chroococcum]|jgi:hypothetical protein|uniref:Uncharacterized protein n=1 Tax=Azotobacter chroococcum TaxID=353 RepID=A0A4R1PPD2_9GAMM|nr:hypothetical protein EV691_10862 [Azotobacter chroococcum]